jgi:hypothetical protein
MLLVNGQAAITTHPPAPSTPTPATSGAFFYGYDGNHDPFY